MSKQEKVIEFKFGINLNNRMQSGCFFYNSNRLIIMYESLGRQKKHDPDYRGIVGIINVPYSAMIPVHSKQAFKNEDEYKILKNAADKFMDQYVRDIKLELNVKDDSLKDFWMEVRVIFKDILKILIRFVLNSMDIWMINVIYRRLSRDLLEKDFLNCQHLFSVIRV
jgi:hypothetical protein